MKRKFKVGDRVRCEAKPTLRGIVKALGENPVNSRNGKPEPMFTLTNGQTYFEWAWEIDPNPT